MISSAKYNAINLTSFLEMKIFLGNTKKIFAILQGITTLIGFPCNPNVM